LGQAFVTWYMLQPGVPLLSPGPNDRVAQASSPASSSTVSVRVSASQLISSGGETPLDKAGEVIARAKSAGSVRAIESGKNLQVPSGPLARARIDITFANAQGLVGADEGIWASIRAGLSTSISGLAYSMRLIVIGLCFVLPWALILYGGWKFWKRRKPSTVVTS